MTAVPLFPFAEYWWFYGFQYPCNTLPDAANDGAHNGDWEHLWVTTNSTRDAIEAVTFFQHSGWYTRRSGGFEMAGDRPMVYVGKRSHGSYDNRCTALQGCTDVPGSSCGYWADFRNPLVDDWVNTGLYLVYPAGDYGALAAWAWGYHRAVDFLLEDFARY